MRKREEIEDDYVIPTYEGITGLNDDVILEVLLDIRELLTERLPVQECGALEISEIGGQVYKCQDKRPCTNHIDT